MLAYLIAPLLFTAAAAPSGAPPPGALKAAIVLPVQNLSVAQDITDADGFVVDRIRWTDGFAKQRTATMVHNDVQDPMGFWGGYLRAYTLNTPKGPRTCTGSTKVHPGFGYTVNHYQGGSNSSRRYKGEVWRWALRGNHHAILEQSWQYPVGADTVQATVQWFFATGRSHPLYAVTFDSSRAGPDVIRADSRAPYGDIGWDGDAGSAVDGLVWGDRFVFRTNKGPVTPATGWDYTTPNTVPFTLAYSLSTDAEMGLVQTQTQEQHDAGGYDGYKLWRTRNRQGPMPDPSSWPYQINQWELPSTNASKRMAWGLNYGAVGQTQYSALGNDRTHSGYPYQSYSTLVVVGAHSRNEVMQQVALVQSVQNTRLTVEGAACLKDSGPGGVGRTDQVAWDVPGYNPVYGTFELRATGACAPMSLTFDVPAQADISGTVLVVHNWLWDAPTVALNQRVLGANTDAYASVDAATKTLWLSITAPIKTGKTRITLTPAAPVSNAPTEVESAVKATLDLLK